MAGCITSDYKDILVNLIDKDTAKEILKIILAGIPDCETHPPIVPAREAVEEAKRKAPEVWGIKPIYFDEAGKETEYSSPSALVKSLGLPMSGIQCDIEGKKCRAQSAVEILRIHGYTVSGDGEPKKASEGGVKMAVYHPQAPQAVVGAG